jgi:mRNA-degrading endonuclease toxin of MazEF toxin-antitoxin module
MAFNKRNNEKTCILNSSLKSNKIFEIGGILMKYSDIKAGNIYYADLNPVREFEFGLHHMSIVLKKGHDKKTVTIVPLTSAKSGLGVNKINLGRMSILPERLTKDKKGNLVNSYAVLDQVRTVAASRLGEIKDGKNPDGTDILLDCVVDLEIFSNLVCKITNFQIANLGDEDAIGEYHKNAFFDYCVKKMIDLTYNVMNGKGNIADNKDEIKYLYANASAMKEHFSIGFHLKKNDKRNNIQERLNEIVLTPVK